jgi:hypothetical protein
MKFLCFKCSKSKLVKDNFVCEEGRIGQSHLLRLSIVLPPLLVWMIDNRVNMKVEEKSKNLVHMMMIQVKICPQNLLLL